MAVIGDQLFFPWCDSNDDLELWTLSSPYGQAARVKDINSQGSSNPESLAIFDNTVYFTADDGEHGPALWRSDGTESGTEMVTEIPAYELTPYSDGFFFLSDGLWVSDGTAGATEKLSDISYFFSDLTVAADHLFYIDEDFYDDKDNALMASDGTAVGTGMVGTTCAAAFGNLTPGGDKLYFSGMDKLGDLELWALNLGNLAPVADFSAAPTRGPAGHTVHFKNGSSGGFDSCTWTFGDGQTASTCGDQAHTYSGTGVYTVSLAISGPGGDDSLTRDQFIHITDDEAVTADFSLTPTFGPTPLTVNFTNLSTGDFETCFWDFGNDETVTGCADQTYTYTQPGIYSVSLSVLGPGGINAKTISEMITVNYPVTTDFIASPTSGIAPLTVSFDNHSTGDFDTCSWDFGDGQTGTNCTGQTHTYDAGGVYTVSLTASGPGGSNTKTISDAITVYGVVTAEFSASPTIGPPPLKVDFKNLSSGTYNTCAWIFGDGISSPSCEDTSHIYNKPGAFDVSLTVAGPGGEDTTAKKVNVLAEMFQSYMPSIVRE
jgi:ELWxxDGT repeat protein